MDAQLKRGLFEAAVLRTLKKGDSYGYMIIKYFSEKKLRLHVRHVFMCVLN